MLPQLLPMAPVWIYILHVCCFTYPRSYVRGKDESKWIQIRIFFTYSVYAAADAAADTAADAADDIWLVY